MSGWVDLVIATLILAIATGITRWMAGAIYYDIGGGRKWAGLLAAAWASGVIVLFVLWQPFWQPFVILLGVLALFLNWWYRQKPSQDRDWAPASAVLPRAVRTGDLVTIENVRNFDYRSLDDFTPRYETRIVHLANLKSVDIIFFNWTMPYMGHPVLVFDFGPDGRICMSIEVRFRKGENYSVIRSLYRQEELIFIAADERDVILRRTKYSQGQKAHLYRLAAEAEEIRTAFLDYVDTINSLYDRPRWYHVVYANCVTSFYQLPHSKWRWDWRVLANGRLDRALYESGRLERALPFRELRRLSYLNDIANSAPEEGFGDYIRHELERRRHER